jgi:hypothetical protein
VLQCQLTNKELDSLVSELLVESHYELKGYFTMLGVACIDSLLNLGYQLIERECLLGRLFELVFIFGKFTYQLIHYSEARNLMFKVYSIVFVYVGSRFEQETNQKVPFNLFYIKKLKEALLSLPSILWVCQSIQ